MSGQRKFRMKAGVSAPIKPEKPSIILVRDGERSYLWCGNDAEGNACCFATIGGPATLRKLAKAILAEVGND